MGRKILRPAGIKRLMPNAARILSIWEVTGGAL
jgi:hypothetical protein